MTEQSQLWKQIDISAGPDGCWPWTGPVAADGYGVMATSRGSARPDRMVYRNRVGAIARDLWISHRCRNRLCCNPAHLVLVVEAVARQEQRGYAADDFWAQVDRSGGPEACWPWVGAVGRDGRGEVRMPARRMGAPRAAYGLTHRMPGAGEVVLHACDNPLCCNPAHLQLGTLADQTRHRLRKIPRPPSDD